MDHKSNSTRHKSNVNKISEKSNIGWDQLKESKVKLINSSVNL